MTQHDGSGDRGAVRYEDPWYDAVASGWGEPPPGSADAVAGPGSNAPGSNAPAPAPAAPATPVAPAPEWTHDAVYLAVHRSGAFAEVRRRHRHFVFPAAGLFLGWYLAYVITATAAPGLMAREVAGGPLNIGLLAGLGQFLSTALITWAYAWNAGRRRDRAALDLRWETQLRTREARR
ncbi:DUF485 domain-containing protein [Streptomyces sp. 549]|uniref:DUF485 domain-containing protein n=1 Tax=Streptomyces sp. 549 TaxID=3049076 RepID=UPI0024C33E3B|nr:DUF485 domain-containing protein [Streptomyces sp. 549]MDK1475950.1 DUF485 domain-containing protein [Streptomyces sp. 549]